MANFFYDPISCFCIVLYAFPGAVCMVFVLRLAFISFVEGFVDASMRVNGVSLG